MKLGYARVSTSDQSLDLQIDALKKYGIDKLFTDTISGKTTSREGLDQALDYLREGDVLVVWKLDRLGRSLPHLISTVTALREKGIEFVSLQESIDTSSAVGKLIFHIFCSLAEFERDLIRERTMAGLAAAKARGRNGGRSKALDPIQVKRLMTIAETNTLTVSELCDHFGISRMTYYRYLKNKTKK